MRTLFNWLFAHDFNARGDVYDWRSDLIWMHIASDVGIAIAYFAIAFALAYFVRRRSTEVMAAAWWLVSAFALLCGATYIMNVVTIWLPVYVLEAVTKVLAAIVCMVTVPVVLRLISIALTLRSPAELERANEQLLAEAEMRRATEQELRLAHEEALQASRAKSGFLANMSHEIRTPMNAVMGMTAALLKTPLTPSQQEIAETIRTSSENLLSIINDVLDLSKIEAGAVSAEAADLQLADVVDQAVLTLAERAQAKGLELISVIEPNVPLVLQGDARRLHQVLVNLTSNAVKFTEKGEVEVRAALESESDSAVVVRFTVRDTGIGILREARERLFQPFMQADNSTTRKYGGTGLGLAISKHLVEVMGGAINCESHTGRGTTFWFSVPLKRSASAPHEAPVDPTNLRGMRALIVDDNDTNRRVIAERLAAWGLTVDQAADGAAALDKVAAIAFGGQAPYHFAIIDRGLPGTGGLELAGRLRQVPALSDMHIVLLHNMVGRDAAAALQGAGVAATLTKPVRHSLLQHTMSVLVARAQLAVPATAATQVKPSASKPPEDALQNKYRILVVEDNHLNQQVAKLQLRELGQEADYANNGLEGLEALQRKTYDLILMDCQMPELDGYDATAEIRKRERGTRHTWIIAMTAHAMVGDRDRCLAAGMDDYIAKPMSTEVLKDALDRFAQRQPAMIGKAAAVAPAAAAAPAPAPAATRKAEGGTVDFAQLRQITKGNTALLRRLAELYVNQTAEQLAMLRTALSERSTVDIQRIAHRCTGSSGTIGMTAMANLFEKLEHAGKAGQITIAEQLASDIESAFVGVRASVKALAAAPPS